jgi:putative salt-induced outer membrane protein YdiY
MRGWDSHAEFGLDGSDGNANTLAIQTGLELKRKTDLYSFGVDIDYRQAMARNVTTEDNGRFNMDYDRMLKDSPWSAFGKFGMEWDRFKAFDLRLNVNGGAGYHWIRTDDATLVTRFGAGAMRKIGAPIDDWIAEAVFGIEAERQLTSRQKLKGKMDYFPAWEDFGNYRLVSDVAWEILLDGSENLSLKLAATDRYDSTPQGAKANDIYYSLLLLYKF